MLNRFWDNQFPETDLTDPVQLDAALKFASSKGYIPKAVGSGLNKLSRSNDADKVLVAANIIAQLTERRPDLANQLSDEDVVRAQQVSRYIELGYGPQESVDMINEVFAKSVEERVSLVKGQYSSTSDYNKAVADLTEDAMDSFDSGFFDDDAELTAAYSADYKQVFELNIGKTGDEDLAAKLTEDHLKGLYGKSYLLDGKGTLTKYSPELLLGGSNERVPWLDEHWNKTKEDTVAVIKELHGVDVSPEDITFLPTGDTMRGSKTWRLYYTDPYNGVPIPVSNTAVGVWAPNQEETSYNRKDARERAQVEKDMLAAEYEYTRDGIENNAIVYDYEGYYLNEGDDMEKVAVKRKAYMDKREGFMAKLELLTSDKNKPLTGGKYEDIVTDPSNLYQ